MPKKKNQKKTVNKDFTINDCANAPKPVTRAKKSAPTNSADTELSWDQIQTDVIDFVEETNPDGSKSVAIKKRENQIKTETNDTEIGANEYPEIVWYQISKHIKPEDVGCFARINKAAYSITKTETFWRSLYNCYCKNHPKLPERLRVEQSYKSYGLRQKVIRALYHTYDIFISKIVRQAAHDSRPHELVKRRCVNVWYNKGRLHWQVYFKLKKVQTTQKVKMNFIEELGNIDANPEEDSQVLQVSCINFYEVPPLMGMTLALVKVGLSQGFRQHTLQMGFHTGNHYTISKNTVPEKCIVLDTVVNMAVYDWWHPKYPYFDTKLRNFDEESAPVLERDFFANDGDV